MGMGRRDLWIWIACNHRGNARYKKVFEYFFGQMNAIWWQIVRRAVKKSLQIVLSQQFAICATPHSISLIWTNEHCVLKVKKGVGKKIVVAEQITVISIFNSPNYFLLQKLFSPCGQIANFCAGFFLPSPCWRPPPLRPDDKLDSADVQSCSGGTKRAKYPVTTATN